MGRRNRRLSRRRWVRRNVKILRQLFLVAIGVVLLCFFLLLRSCLGFWENSQSSDSETLVENTGYSVVNGQVLPLEGTITSAFGQRESPINGQEEIHTGVDIAAAMDTPILAVMDGTVTQAGYDEEKGNYVQLDHGGQVETRYYHCNSLCVQAGDTVTQGQEIAKVGTTGNSTGYHLHFELRVNGEPKNPATWKEYWNHGVSLRRGPSEGLLFLSAFTDPLSAAGFLSAGPYSAFFHAVS